MYTYLLYKLNLLRQIKRTIFLCKYTNKKIIFNNYTLKKILQFKL